MKTYTYTMLYVANDDTQADATAQAMTAASDAVAVDGVEILGAGWARVSDAKLVAEQP